MDLNDTDNNVLEPIILPDGEAGKFAYRHRCAGCLGYLFLKEMLDHKWKVICPKCGDIIEGGYIHESKAEIAEHRKLLGLRELRPDKPRRSEDEILAELGFD